VYSDRKADSLGFNLKEPKKCFRFSHDTSILFKPKGIVSYRLNIPKGASMFLGLKFFIALFLVMFVGLAALTYTNVTSEADDLLEQVELAALRTTDLIKESTHYSMLINRKEDIHQTFENFSQMPGFEVIRIYDKEGEVIFTTRPEEASTRVTINSEACQVCHRYPEPLKALETKERHRIITAPDGHRILALINPVEKSPPATVPAVTCTRMRNSSWGSWTCRCL
jgi:hypothetical protein